MQYFKKILPHLVVLLLFVIASLAYFSPVLQGKKIFQSDIVQYSGMAKQQNDFKKTTGEETYWTNAAFGGMPTYQLGARYPHNYIKKLDLTLRFLPRPADYLFLYFIGIYILFLILKVDYKLAFVGALAFGFSTYLIIILGVGHNAKAHAIAYMPLVISGILLTFQRKYFYGFLLTAVAMALELAANHFQMTYYLLLLVVIIGIVYLIEAIKNKTLPEYFKAIAIMVGGVVLAIGMNATNILATKEYADTSTRGKSELTIHPDGTEKSAGSSGLSYDYITEYSYGKLESFNLFIPRFMGGGSAEPFPKDPETLDVLLKMGASLQDANQILNQIPMYWGDQTFVGAPAYIGAVIIFLAILALFLIKGKIKWWITAGFLLSLFLSWGKNLSFLTELFIDYVPLYNKFRAVSSIQVIIELLMPILAIVGLHHYFYKTENPKERQKALLTATGITGGITLLFILFKGSLFGFASPIDPLINEAYGVTVTDAIREDRMTLLTNDAIRSLVLILATTGILWFFIKNKLKVNSAIALLAVIILIDLIGVDRRYVNNDDFVQARRVERPFQENFADKEILKDDGYFRVYDASVGNPFASGRASYFHNALGGYHAAKTGRIQDLEDFYISKGDIGILNMMNVRYIAVAGKNGTPIAQRNPYANGPAWLVENVILANNANEEIQFLDSLNTKKTAIINKEYSNLLPTAAIQRDTIASLQLVSHTPSHLVYESITNTPQLAIFSEVYYPKGWNAYIDDQPAEYFRANYVLRAMQIPAGTHKIEYKFEPQVVATGSKITLASSISFMFLLLGGLYFNSKKSNSFSKE